MSVWYWLLWAILTIVNGGMWFAWSRGALGLSGSVIFKGRVYRVIEQQWDFDAETRRIVAAHTGYRPSVRIKGGAR